MHDNETLKCTITNLQTVMTKSEILQLLQATKAFTIQSFDLSENELNKTYGSEKWTVRQILHHLTDTEFLFIGRLKKIIAEPKQVIWAFNQDDWNNAFDYFNEPLTGKKELYSLCREMNYQLIEKYYDKYFQKEFVHSETGLRTLQMEFEKVAKHNQSHNEQIKMALAR
jgi:hypothetical protein